MELFQKAMQDAGQEFTLDKMKGGIISPKMAETPGFMLSVLKEIKLDTWAKSYVLTDKG